MSSSRIVHAPIEECIKARRSEGCWGLLFQVVYLIMDRECEYKDAFAGWSSESKPPKMQNSNKYRLLLYSRETWCYSIRCCERILEQEYPPIDPKQLYIVIFEEAIQEPEMEGKIVKYTWSANTHHAFYLSVVC